MQRYLRQFAVVLLVVAPHLAARAAEPQDSLRRLLGEQYDGAKLLAHRDGWLVRVDLDTLAVRKLIQLAPEREGLWPSRPCWSRDGKQIVAAFAGQCWLLDDAPNAAPRRILKARTVYEASFWDDPQTGERCVVYKTAEGRHSFPDDAGAGETRRYRLRTGVDEKLHDFPCDGGLSPDGTYLAEGFAQVLLLDLVTGTSVPLFRGGPGCHASIAPDGSNRVMHLIGTHQRIRVRNVSDREMLSIPHPVGYGAWRMPRWATHADYAAGVCTRDGKGRLVLVNLLTRETLAIDALEGDWANPHLWLPGGRDQLGAVPTPLAGIELDRAEHYGRLLGKYADWEALAAALRSGRAPNPGKEDARVARAIAAYRHSLAAEAEAAEDPFAQRGLYVRLARNFPYYARVLTSARFRRTLEESPHIQRLRQLTAGLKSVADAPADFSSDPWREANQRALFELIPLLEEMKRRFPGRPAGRLAEQAIARYKLPLETPPQMKNLGLLGTVEAVSDVPPPEHLAPYTEALVYVRYRVTGVQSGTYAHEKVVVVQWGMKNAKLTDAAKLRPGTKQMLELAPFAEQPQRIRNVYAATDADVPELPPYWAVSTLTLATPPAEDAGE